MGNYTPDELIILENHIPREFKIGRYKITDMSADGGVILITKIKNGFVWFDIKSYDGWSYSLYNVKVRRKIFRDKYGDEYIKPLHYVWNTIFTPSARQIDSESGFDRLDIRMGGGKFEKKLQKIDDVSIDYDEKHYPINEDEITTEQEKGLELLDSAIKYTLQEFEKLMKEQIA